VVIAPFAIGRLPQIHFGEGVRARVPELAACCGRRVLLVTGARSLRASRHWEPLLAAFRQHELEVQTLAVSGEPSPALVDGAVREHRGPAIDVVVAVGGGSALDAGKAIAGLLLSGRPVGDFLEAVGRGLPYEGPATPLVAVPTSAGTGSEATRNAVLSEVGERGFKKSFRHDALVPRWAVVDSELLESCPRPLIAADGMDALTQLLEAYVSTRASAFTDAIAESGLAAARDGLLPWYEGRGDQRAARSRMAWAALASGLALAQAGLGAVHGLAAALGARFPLPHGYVCGTLASAATAVNVRALRAREPGNLALAKFARAWAVLAGGQVTETDLAPPDAPERLVSLLEEWCRRLELPRLGARGVGEEHVPALVAASRGSSMKTNPIVLTDDEVAEILRRRM
jgi:alcohol dehydrogenase